MNCQQATKHIWGYCDNKLSPSLSLRLEKHCEDCEECRRLLRLTRLENEVLCNSPELPELPPDFTSRVMSCLPAIDKQLTRKKPPAWSGFSRFRTAAAAVLGVVMLLIVAPYIINNAPVPGRSMQPVPGSDSLVGEFSNHEILKDEPGQITPTVITNNQPLASVDNSAASEEKPASTKADDKTVSSSPRSQSAPAESSRGKTFFPYSINLPAAYQLVNNPVYSGNTVVYQYVQSGSDCIVLVTVAKLESMPEKSEMTNSASTQTSKSVPAPDETAYGTALRSTTTAPAPPTHANSVVSWIVQADDQVYRITLDGNLSPQELALLAGAIEFRKGS